MARRVRVVVVHYGDPDHTRRCVQALRAASWPGLDAEIVVVDNDAASGGTRLDGLEAGAGPTVSILTPERNLGFAGGCNLALGDLTGLDFVALVNNDAVVGPDWIAPLVETIDGDTRCGAACPKIVLDGRFRAVDFDRDDGAEVWLHGLVRPDGTSPPAQRVGFGGPEPCATGWRWSVPAGARLYVDAQAPSVDVELSAARPATVVARSGAQAATLAVAGQPRRFAIELDGDAVRLVNNAGTVLLDDGYGADRGLAEPDDGRYDVAGDVFAWCGAAVLLRADYLRSVGVFDERLFLYYEDLELSWRGRRRGWTYRYEPRSEVEHVHAASAGEWTARSEQLKERNRIVVLIRHRGAWAGARAIARFAVLTGSYLVRDAVRPMLHGRRPRPVIAIWRARSLAGALRLAPHAIAARRSARSTESA